jgi:hypothetical protein
MRSLNGGKTERLHGLVRADAVVLLVVLAFCVALLMPMLARARSTTTRDRCASNLSGIGKAMLIYSNDYENQLPRAGGRESGWGKVNWAAATRYRAYGLGPNGAGGNATISSCFYLLVKYAEAHPKLFVCEDDPCVSIFELDKEADKDAVAKLFEAWDFGSAPQTHCSYAYQSPWEGYPLTAARNPQFAIAADRNPYIPSPGMKTAKTFIDPNDPAIVFAGKAGSVASQMYGNSTVHGGDGQNVLFLDDHVVFATRPYYGLDDDDVYTVSTLTDKGDSLGVIPKTTAAEAAAKNRRDSVLVHDPLVWPDVAR